MGTDLPAGRYRGTTNGSDGYWEVSTDANGMDLIANGMTKGQFYVSAKSGQYLQLQSVTITLVN